MQPTRDTEKGNTMVKLTAKQAIKRSQRATGKPIEIAWSPEAEAYLANEAEDDACIGNKIDYIGAGWRVILTNVGRLAKTGSTN